MGGTRSSKTRQRLRTKKLRKRNSAVALSERGFKYLKKEYNIRDVPFSRNKPHKGSKGSCGSIDYHYQSYRLVHQILEALPGKFQLCLFQSHPSGAFPLGAMLTLDMENLRAGIACENGLSSFLEILQECLDSDAHFIPIILNIRGDEENHANILLIDTKKKRVELYEPHGYATSSSSGEWGITGAYKKKMKAVQRFFKQHLPEFKKVENTTRFVQETAFQMLRDPEKSSGYCVTWTILFVHYRLLNPDLSLKVLMNYLHKRITTMKLLQYARFMEEQLKSKAKESS